MEKKTPLYDCHCALDGRMVPFAGYLLPVQYPTGVITEHMTVRGKAGLFDVSHMGELFLTGTDALTNLNELLTNDFTTMKNGQVRYSLMCNENGGVIDDLLVYRFHEEKYMIVVNAANRDKDVQWIMNRLSDHAELQDCSEEIALLALQGPNAKEILLNLTDEKNLPDRYYSFLNNCTIDGITCLISQTGYTGEHGYEIYLAANDAPVLWEKLLKTGSAYGLIPCGLGARDTLRLEAAMPLYGHELTEEITPLEAGLSFAVKMNKNDFIGRKALERQTVPSRIRVGLQVKERGIIREQCSVYHDTKQIGAITSGTHCPFLGGSYGMALIESEYSKTGTELQVEVRGRMITVTVVPLPFYKRT